MPTNLTVVNGRPTYREGADTHAIIHGTRSDGTVGPIIVEKRDTAGWQNLSALDVAERVAGMPKVGS